MQFRRTLPLLLLIALCALPVTAVERAVRPMESWDPAGFYPAGLYHVETISTPQGLLDVYIVPGRPPQGFRMPAAPTRAADDQLTGAVKTLAEVPAFDWSYGCAPTAASMLAGYYDRHGFPNCYTGPLNGGVCPLTNAGWGRGECPLSATHQGYDGRASYGHVDDYYLGYNSTSPDPYLAAGRPAHTWGDCTADFMGANQSALGVNDGSTRFYYSPDGSPLANYAGGEPTRRDGCRGLRQFFESRGYPVVANYNQYIKGYNGNTKGFTFAQYQAEIDAGRPVLIHVTGHTMLGVGYDDAGQKVYLHDTWDYQMHSMTWAGSYSGMQHYGVSVIQLAQSNRPPSAAQDSYAYTPAVPRVVAAPGVLANDADADGDALQAVLDANPAHGTLTLHANGAFTYTPVAGYAGADQFTYHVTDGRGGVSAVAAVRLTAGGPALTAVSLAASPLPNALGRPLTLTATPTGGTTPEYQFYRQDGTTWVSLMDNRYRPARTFTWSPPATGNYRFRVRCREVGATAYVYKDLVVTVRPPLSGVGLTATPNPAAAGARVTFTATPVNGGQVEYQCLVLLNGSWVSLTQDRYQRNPASSWTPPAAGVYRVRIRAREVGANLPAINHDILLTVR